MRISLYIAPEGKRKQGCCGRKAASRWREGREKEAIRMDNVRWAEWSASVSRADHRLGRIKPGWGWMARVSVLAGLRPRTSRVRQKGNAR